MNKFPILFLSRSDIQPLVGMSDVLTYVEEAFSLYSKSESGANIAHFSPMVSFPTKIPNTDMDYRAGLMDPIPAACSTLGFGYWDNPVNYNMPSVFAFSYLSDVKHAKPLAFMECYYLGGMRTGAAGGVASKYVAKKNPKSLIIACDVFQDGNINLCNYLFKSKLNNVRLFNSNVIKLKSLFSTIQSQIQSQIQSENQKRKSEKAKK